MLANTAAVRSESKIPPAREACRLAEEAVGTTRELRHEVVIIAMSSTDVALALITHQDLQRWNTNE
jgi:hypothetical protein